MGVLWKREPATAAKHRLYKRYLDAWWPIMLQPTRDGYLRPRVTYIDAFAGPGRYEDGEEGSPVFVLDRLLNHKLVDRMRLRRDRVHLVFIEKVLGRYEYLCSELERCFGSLNKLPVHVEVRHGEARNETESALNELGAWNNPILAVFDSWGNVGVPLALVQRIAQNKSSEVIITFGPNWFSRRENLNADMFDMVFGGRRHWEPADREAETDERWRAWLATYRDALSRAGFAYRLQFQVVPRTGQPLYLVYGTGHPSGVDAMKDAMWDVDGNDGMSFRDPRTRGAEAPGQLGLWGGRSDSTPELLELVTQRLREGPTTVEQLGDWLLCETARWRRTHARPAVRDLRESGVVAVEPSTGQITGRTVVKLR